MDTNTDIGPLYFTVFSIVLAAEIIVLFLCCLITFILPPNDHQVEFPPPPGYSGMERRKVEVPDYPSSLELAYLIAVYALDIILIYPYTREGSASQHDTLYRLAGIVIFGIQVTSAVGWNGIKT